jgi:hypothetical protein
MSLQFSPQEKEQVKAYVIGWGGNS